MSLWSAFFPLYIIFGVVLVPFVICRCTGMTFLFMLGIMSTVVLLPLKVENKFTFTWTIVFLPIIICTCLVFLQVLYVVVNDMVFNYRQRLRLQTRTQRLALVGYLIGLSLIVVGGLMSTTRMDASGKFASTPSAVSFLTIVPSFLFLFSRCSIMLGGLFCFFVFILFSLFSPLFSLFSLFSLFFFLFQQGALQVLPVFLGFFICAASVVAIACDIARDYIFNQGARPLPDTEEVGTTQFGAEEWLGIGSFLFYFFFLPAFLFCFWFGRIFF